MRAFIFKVKLGEDRRIWRMIEALEGQTLDDLHWAIQEAYGFDGDHLYSYFMSGKAWDTSGYEYYHPDATTREEEKAMREIAKTRGRFPKPRRPATKVKLESLVLKPKQRFLYLFDYGDEWLFEVEFIGEGVSVKAHYPRVVGSRGDSPQQYDDE